MRNPIQPYTWGMRGDEAFIPRLLGVTPEPGVPYAELWMGAHPKAPSAVLVEGEPVALDRWIATYPQEILGREVAARFDNRLPFLFKVLSAGEALSIQVHPNKAQAEVLHVRDPENYPDDNHKPELAVALDSLSALIGIKPYAGIVETLDRYPELAQFVGEVACGALQEARGASEAVQWQAARAAFATLITRAITHERELVRAVETLAARLCRTPTSHLREEERLFCELRTEYPADVGLLAIFMLNLVHLTAGQGVFIAAGMPHAYVRGNIIECMANSDNVVRVGLTPKFKDAQALVDILADEPQPVAILNGGNAPEVIYRTPAREFQVSRWRMEPGERRSETTGGRLEVMLVTRGEITLRWGSEAETFRQGDSILIPAMLERFVVQAQSAAELFRVEVPNRDHITTQGGTHA